MAMYKSTKRHRASESGACWTASGSMSSCGLGVGLFFSATTVFGAGVSDNVVVARSSLLVIVMLDDDNDDIVAVESLLALSFCLAPDDDRRRSSKGQDVASLLLVLLLSPHAPLPPLWLLLGRGEVLIMAGRMRRLPFFGELPLALFAKGCGFFILRI